MPLHPSGVASDRNQIANMPCLLLLTLAAVLAGHNARCHAAADETTCEAAPDDAKYASEPASYFPRYAVAERLVLCCCTELLRARRFRSSRPALLARCLPRPISAADLRGRSRPHRSLLGVVRADRGPGSAKAPPPPPPPSTLVCSKTRRSCAAALVSFVPAHNGPRASCLPKPKHLGRLRWSNAPPRARGARALHRH